MESIATAILLETLYQQFLALGQTDTRAEFVSRLHRVKEAV